MHENDDDIPFVVKCVCSTFETDGLTVQCELCLTWQHGPCVGFASEEEVPVNGYFCEFCRNPKRSKRSQRASYQLNHWLKNGYEPVFMPEYSLPNNQQKKNKIQNQKYKQKKDEKMEVNDDDNNSSYTAMGLKNSFVSQVQKTNQLELELQNILKNLKLLHRRKMLKSAAKKGNSNEEGNGNGNEGEDDEDKMILKQEALYGVCVKQCTDELDKIEAEMMAQEDNYGINSSNCSTLTAPSPEHFALFSTEQKLSKLTSTSIITCPNYLQQDNRNISSEVLDEVYATTSTSITTLTNSNEQLKKQQQQNEVFTLGRLITSPPGPGSSSAAVLKLEQDPALLLPQNTQNRHQLPTMTRDYLPVNNTDAQLKLDIAHLKKDLKAAREFVLSMITSDKPR